MRRRYKIERFHAVKKMLRVVFSDFPSSFSIAASTLFKLILALVCITNQMPNIGYIHHAINRIAVNLQCPN